MQESLSADQETACQLWKKERKKGDATEKTAMSGIEAPNSDTKEVTRLIPEAKS